MSTKKGECDSCSRYRLLTRNFCGTCYSRKIKTGELKRIGKKISPPKLTKKQEQVLVGSMLGDGCLYINNCRGKPYFSLRRKLTDKQYLLYEFNVFKKFCNLAPKELATFDKRTDKIYYAIGFQTRSSSALFDYYIDWYGNGKKKLPKSFNYDTLTPLVCAIWFCDDGCITIDKKTNRLKLKLATQSFSKKENQLLIKILQKKLCAPFSLCKDGELFLITASDYACRKFIDYIKNHIPKEMKRKVTWTKSQLARKESLPQRKNRKDLLTEKEQMILKEIQKFKLINPHKIAKNNNLLRNNKTPTWIHYSLSILYKKGLILKKGIKQSYKNPINYYLSKKGFNYLELISQ